MTPRMAALVIACMAATLLGVAWAVHVRPPTPSLRELPRATGALVQVTAEQAVIRQREDAAAQRAADSARKRVAQVRQVRAARPVDLSAVLVDTTHRQYVAGLELAADQLATATDSLVTRDSAFRVLVAAHADTIRAHAVRLDTLARAAVAEARSAERRGVKRGLVVGAVLGVAVTVALVLFSP